MMCGISVSRDDYNGERYCKSLMRMSRYVPSYGRFLDMFPHTDDINPVASTHVESVVLITRKEK